MWIFGDAADNLGHWSARFFASWLFASSLALDLSVFFAQVDCRPDLFANGGCRWQLDGADSILAA
jgi:hypothetical protein